MTTTGVSYELNTLREAVQSKFSKLRAALYMREKLLLRQLEVIGQQVETEPLGIQWLTDDQQETALYENVRSFGRFQLDNMNLALQQPNSKQEEPCEEQESELLSFTQNKLLMEDTCRQISESIINLTLTEAKKLLNQTQHKIVANFVPALNLEELEEEITSSQVDAISSLLQDQTQSTTQKTPACKHKIVINNCNGTINLRNIASLIINCTGEEAVNTELPLQAAENTITTTTSSSANQCQCKLGKNQTNRKQKVQESVKYANHSINSSSLCSHRNKQHQHMKLQQQTQIIEEPTTAATCEFYNNLLQQIKHSLVSNKQHKEDVENDNDYAYYMKQGGSQDAEEQTQLTSVSDVDVNENENETMSGTNSTQSQTQSQQVDGSSNTTNNNRRLVLRNFENLKIILEANSDEETSHPVQIEQWLAEIISESDLEPITNTDFLEHSKIDSS